MQDTAAARAKTEESREGIWKIFQSAGIEPWELFVVDNSETSDGAIAAGPPPLDYYRKEILAKKAAKVVRK